MKFDHRYDENAYTLSLSEMAELRDARVCVVGCGSVGGYVIEMLARLGVGTIVAVDGGIFKEQNLNRQLFCTESNLGNSKAFEAKKRVEEINSEVRVIAVGKALGEENADEIITGSDLVIEAVDSIKVRMVLGKACRDHSIVMVHGASAGWYAQISTIYPGDTNLSRIYPGGDHGAEKELGKPSFTPALIASLEVAEAVKVLLHKGVPLKSRMLSIDLLLQEYEVFGV